MADGFEAAANNNGLPPTEDERSISPYVYVMTVLLAVASIVATIYHLLERKRAREEAAETQRGRPGSIDPKNAVKRASTTDETELRKRAIKVPADEKAPLTEAEKKRSSVSKSPQVEEKKPNEPMVNGSQKMEEEESMPPEKEIFDRRESISLLQTIGATSTVEAVMSMHSLNDLSDVMKLAGLEQCNLIFGIDYTASNKYQGTKSFGGKSLHTIGEGIVNPYQEVIAILGKTLQPFATSTLGIPAYGFGDIKTSDSSVFPLNGELESCKSFDELLEVYNRLTPKIILSGPTNFAPLIAQAVEICKLIKDYHILVIIADGQVTNELATRRAIVDACKYPLSIIVVGVGDGPWQMMKVFDKSLPKRPWHNFHFVHFNEVKSKMKDSDIGFAAETLLEIPDQYKDVKRMGLLNFEAT